MGTVWGCRVFDAKVKGWRVLVGKGVGVDGFGWEQCGVAKFWVRRCRVGGFGVEEVWGCRVSGGNGVWLQSFGCEGEGLEGFEWDRCRGAAFPFIWVLTIHHSSALLQATPGNSMTTPGNSRQFQANQNQATAGNSGQLLGTSSNSSQIKAREKRRPST